MSNEQDAAAMRTANALGLAGLSTSIGCPPYKSAACEHPRAVHAQLTDADLERAQRHPVTGERPQWSGYCVRPDMCVCVCHGPAISAEIAIGTDTSGATLDGVMLADLGLAGIEVQSVGDR